jgi:hypothetical protein
VNEERRGRHMADDADIPAVGRPTADLDPLFIAAGKDIVAHDDIVEVDEATGTPPRIRAETRTAVYVSALIFNAVCLLVFGLLPIFDLLDPGKAAQAMNVIITAINLVCMGLAVGYRPTRAGSPVKP